ncbi:GATOR2 complex protein WDR59-like [Oncorhynchus masou masou]|uniref:GATOR2 complex protein WDR59-like n=1 Tax=Oncorhynchus masou masou TaxID=90313 RepID=UPI00318378CF
MFSECPKPNTAVEYVAAHLSKIHGLDWHPDNEYILATSSQDNSVRFWDYRQPRKYLSILSCQVPVWKARYTPFSNGLVTVMVPQLRRENSLLLWSALDLNSPVHAFVGHDDVVLEFQWRPQKEASKEYQMVTLSRDQTLRIWRLDPQLQKLCANDLVEDPIEGISLTTESEKSLPSQDPEPTIHSCGLPAEHLQDQAGALTSGGRHDPSALPQTLQQEFSLVNLQIRNVNVEMDAVNRSCVVSAVFGTNQVHLVVKFPSHYPNNAAPSFQFISPTTIPTAMRTRIQKILTDTSLQKVKRNQNCLEPCVRQLVSCLESYMTQEDGSAANPYVLSNPVTPALPAFPRVTNTYGSYQDANIPFPRTSGARFCGTGCLVYFTRPITMHRSVPPTEPTPRSLSALSAYHSGVLTPMKMRSESQSSLRLYSGSPTHTDKDHVSISSFYYKERVRHTLGCEGHTQHTLGRVGHTLGSCPLKKKLQPVTSACNLVQKPNTAVEYVAAHLSKIHGLDWHPDNEYILATSSQDNSVRFWDYRQPRKYLSILSCQVPVWKARYTPFSNGLVTVMVPQLRRENSLLLWSALDLNSPVHAFVGHDDVVLEFQWRPQKEVPMWFCGVIVRHRTNVVLWCDCSTPYQCGSVMDAVNRSCVVSAVFGTNQVHLVVKFPSHYPNNAAPSFQFISPTTIPTAMRTRIQKILTDTSLQKVKRNQNCLEPCVRQLVSCLESYMVRRIHFKYFLKCLIHESHYIKNRSNISKVLDTMTLVDNVPSKKKCHVAQRSQKFTYTSAKYI